MADDHDNEVWLWWYGSGIVVTVHFPLRYEKSDNMELVTVVEIWFRLSSKFQLISK